MFMVDVRAVGARLWLLSYVRQQAKLEHVYHSATELVPLQPLEWGQYLRALSGERRSSLGAQRTVIAPACPTYHLQAISITTIRSVGYVRRCNA
jgi:hypothetical protein